MSEIEQAAGTTAVPGPPKDGAGHGFGLPTATALVVGSVIGTGVFGLPSALAAHDA